MECFFCFFNVFTVFGCTLPGVHLFKVLMIYDELDDDDGFGGYGFGGDEFDDGELSARDSGLAIILGDLYEKIKKKLLN
jgi:hypothetical protein